MSSRLLSPTWLGAAVIRYTSTSLEAAFASRDREGSCSQQVVEAIVISNYTKLSASGFGSESDGRCK